MVKCFAKDAGDLNPLHHDEGFAQQSPYKGLITSGAQTSSLLLGATATLVHTGLWWDWSFLFDFEKQSMLLKELKLRC